MTFFEIIGWKCRMELIKDLWRSSISEKLQKGTINFFTRFQPFKFRPSQLQKFQMNKWPKLIGVFWKILKKWCKKVLENSCEIQYQMKETLTWNGTKLGKKLGKNMVLSNFVRILPSFLLVASHWILVFLWGFFHKFLYKFHNFIAKKCYTLHGGLHRSEQIWCGHLIAGLRSSNRSCYHPKQFATRERKCLRL